MNNNQANFINILTVLGFAMDVLNYNQNVGQSDLQNTAQDIIEDIHNHLKMQDEKIDLILDKLSKDGV